MLKIKSTYLVAIMALALLWSIDARSGPIETPASRPLIGMAWMKPEGTIVLDLHSGRESDYTMAHFEYPPDHKDYRMVLVHLGGLAPGERKGVPPWPDKP
jgi:hypothetical protein